MKYLFVFLFCLGVIVPHENFSLKWKCQHYWWRPANFDICSALMAIEQWRLFRMPHLLWHGTSVYNGHLQVPMTFTQNAESLVVELLLSVFTTFFWSCRDSNTQPSVCGVCALTIAPPPKLMKYITLINSEVP